MSGLEVIGLVLGVVPLVAAGLKQYGEGVQILKRTRRYASELKRLKLDVDTYDGLFRDLLEQVLSGCVEDDAIISMMADPHAAAWQNPAVIKAVKRKLGRSYETFLEYVSGMGRTFEEFKAELGLQTYGEALPRDRNLFREGWKRTKFALKESTYQKLMEKVWRELEILKMLIGFSASLEPSRARRSRSGRKGLDGYISSLFAGLQQALRSSCQSTHAASLCVKALDHSIKEADSGDSESATFRVILHHTDSSSSAISKTFEEAEIQTSDRNVPMPAQHATTPDVTTRKKRGVRFSVDVGPKTVTAGSSVRQTSQSIVGEAQDLCVSMRRLQSHACDVCMEYLPDQLNGPRHSLYRPSKPILGHGSHSTLTLGEALGTSDVHHRLDRPARLRLAIALALATISLRGTPWLAEQWGHKQVTFFRQDDLIIADHPFISADLKSLEAPVGQSCAVGQLGYFTKCSAIQDQTLFALGILLIELWWNKPFEDLMLPVDRNPDGKKHAASDYLAAMRLAAETDLDASKRYGNAIRYFIQHGFDRTAIYDNVVDALEEVADWNGGT